MSGNLQVLYKEHRAERRELLDDLVIGTPAAAPLPKLEQVIEHPDVCALQL